MRDLGASFRVAPHSAFVLHQRQYAESSLLLEVFSQRHGRVGLIAKGARRLKSPQRGVLQAFRRLELAWAGRGELPTLTQADVEGPALALSGSRLLSAFYLNELLLRLLHRHDPHAELFEHYGAALEALASETAEEPTLRVFEKRLLDAVGYGLLLEHEGDSGAPLVENGIYQYHVESGPWRSLPGEPAVVVSGATLRALRAERFEGPEQLREAKALMRQVLAHHLDGRELNSRRLYEALEPGH